MKAACPGPSADRGFIRGKATGLNMIELTCQMYEIDADATRELVADLVSDPATLARPMEHWPLHARQEFSFALALAPAFDVYVIEGAIPFEPCRFTRLWLALFEQRLIGRTLILSSYRQNQLADYCLKGLIYERSALRIEDDLDQCIREFPATLKKRIRQRRRRRSRRIRRGPARPLTAAPRSNAAAERQAMVGERRRRRWLNALIVVAPVACALIYALSIATPRYEAESRFVQSGSGQQGGGHGGQPAHHGQLGRHAGRLRRRLAVSDFLKSRDCMRQLDRKIGLRQILLNAGMDPVNHLSEDSSEDDLYRAYRASVQVSFNALEQIDVLRVRASPQDAETLSRA